MGSENELSRPNTEEVKRDTIDLFSQNFIGRIEVLTDLDLDYPNVYTEVDQSGKMHVVSIKYLKEKGYSEKIIEDAGKIKSQLRTFEEIRKEAFENDINATRSFGLVTKFNEEPVVILNTHQIWSTHESIERVSYIDEESDIAIVALSEVSTIQEDKISVYPVAKISNKELDGRKVSLVGIGKMAFRVEGRAILRSSIDDELGAEKKEVDGFFILLPKETELNIFNGISGAPVIDDDTKEAVGIVCGGGVISLNGEAGRRTFVFLQFIGPDNLRESLKQWSNNFQ